MTDWNCYFLRGQAISRKEKRLLLTPETPLFQLYAPDSE